LQHLYGAGVGVAMWRPAADVNVEVDIVLAMFPDAVRRSVARRRRLAKYEVFVDFEVEFDEEVAVLTERRMTSCTASPGGERRAEDSNRLITRGAGL